MLFWLGWVWFAKLLIVLEFCSSIALACCFNLWSDALCCCWTADKPIAREFNPSANACWEAIAASLRIFATSLPVSLIWFVDWILDSFELLAICSLSIHALSSFLLFIKSSYSSKESQLSSVEFVIEISATLLLSGSSSTNWSKLSISSQSLLDVTGLFSSSRIKLVSSVFLVSFSAKVKFSQSFSILISHPNASFKDSFACLSSS